MDCPSQRNHFSDFWRGSPKENFCEIIRAFIHNLLIYKFHEHPMKTKGLVVMTRSKLGIFPGILVNKGTYLYNICKFQENDLHICKFQEDSIET